jgi:hypothetical protein
MGTYYFVGSFADFGNGTQLVSFGQTVQLEDQAAAEYVAHGVALLTEAEFTELEFDPAHIKKHSTIALQENAPEDFTAKRKRAWEIIHQKRTAAQAAKGE